MLGLCCSNPREAKLELALCSLCHQHSDLRHLCHQNGARPDAVVKHCGAHCTLVFWCFRWMRLCNIAHLQVASSFLLYRNTLWWGILSPTPSCVESSATMFTFLSPCFLFFSPHLSPLLVVCVILMYVYKTGFFCFLNTSSPTHSSQPAEQGLDTLILGSFQSIALFPSFFPLNLGAERAGKNISVQTKAILARKM